MPRYLVFVSAEGGFVFSDDSPHLDHARKTMTAAGEFEADDDAAAHAELTRRVAELQQRMEAARR